MFRISTLALLTVAATGAYASFYGGDFDDTPNGPAGTYGWTASPNGTDNYWMYDDFAVGGPAELVKAVWGNFLILSTTPVALMEYEIRSGLSGSGLGTLMAAGNGTAVVTATGRGIPSFNALEFQIMLTGLSDVLTAGTYHLGLHVLSSSSNPHYLSVTDGVDRGPATDPNPAPNGSPIDNGNAFQLNVGTGSITGTDGDDLSIGISSNVVPEPSTVAILAVGLALAALRRRK